MDGALSAAAAEALLCCCPVHRVCGRAPFAPGDDVIEGLVAASASALTRGSLSADRLPPPPSSARTASVVPADHARRGAR